MSIERRNFPQFFITAPSPCPYLPGRQERKVFTHLVSNDAKAMNSQLSSAGFRRSQNIAYRPACDSCSACKSVRVPVAEFDWTPGFRRILRRNEDLHRVVIPAKAVSEHYSLFREYIDTRHSDGGMADMTVLDFAAMVDETVVETKIIEYRLHRTSINSGELVAAALVDVLTDGLSMIYSFYNPSMGTRGLGTFMILDTIQSAAEAGLEFVYLGYWIEGSEKMHYKSRFLPQQRLSNTGWIAFKR
jgi:leucyl-tRNA---protein transferase